jgi:hypothetical protein
MFITNPEQWSSSRKICRFDPENPYGSPACTIVGSAAAAEL